LKRKAQKIKEIREGNPILLDNVNIEAMITLLTLENKAEVSFMLPHFIMYLKYLHRIFSC